MVTSIKSNTSRRQELAVDKIPQLVSELLIGARGLDEGAVELLYREYRAYYCSKRPFRSTIHKCKNTDFSLLNDWSVHHILEYLRVPEMTRKDEVICALNLLLAEIRSNSQKKSASL